MLFQISGVIRLAIVYLIQFPLGFFSLFISYKILKRKKTPLSITISSYFISYGITYLLNLIYIWFNQELLFYVFYLITSLFYMLGPLLLVIATHLLLYREEITRRRIYFFIAALLSYSLTILLILMYPENLIIVTQTSIPKFTPVFSWNVLYSVYIIYTLFIIAPEIYLVIRTFNILTEKNLKKRLIKFFIGAFLSIFTNYITILYLAWNNEVFKIIFLIYSFCAAITYFILIYNGIGRSL